MDKRFLAILTTIIVIFGGIFIYSQRSNNGSGGSTLGSQTEVSNHVTGQGQKNVTLLEYGDYQCSVCEGYEPVLEQIRAAYSNDIYFQFRNLPLVSIHPNAFAAARAAEAASLQDKFWEMHDALYSHANWQSWTVSSSPIDLFKVYAQQLGLDVSKFQSDFASDKVNSTIQADLGAFKKTKQQMSTPTFFLDGAYLETSKLTDQNNHPLFDKFKAVLDAEIAKQQPKQ